MNRRLYRSRTDSVLGGVAGGVAEYLDVDPSIVRIVWAVLAIITGGIFFVLYIVMWIVVPETPSGMWAPGPGPAAAPAPDGSASDTPESAAPPAGTEPPRAQPWSSAGYPQRSGRRGGSGGMIFGLILVGLGIWFLLDEYVPWLRADLLWPVGLVVVGLALLAVSMRRNEG
ncbi:MAG TPA: PspC domain-containing protein [Candidatus Limnocylindrales bacterium]|nr:PspC domain-containing protein [Candidatus Limnocylindrales bacterium]